MTTTTSFCQKGYNDAEYVPLTEKKPLGMLSRIAKRPPIDIEFQDLTYSVRDRRCKGGWRQLLRSVNGCFRSGELTAILGPSGAGKSTLLNILAGYVSAGVKGSIKINDRPREMRLFNKLSSYIMQDDIVQPRLTVKESMMVAANLKLSSSIIHSDKEAVVDEVISLLGLEKCYSTRSEHLSGGQRRRLSIALELVNNPPVIFLDEPTTGLDNYAIKQCMDLLHKISKQGRTVICTIHQPPASLFQTFDQVYVVANGFCVYNGTPSQLVPFLEMTDFPCPASNTPADFVIEIVSQYPETVEPLSTHIQNGKLNLKNKTKEKESPQIRNSLIDVYQETTQGGLDHLDVTFPIGFLPQFFILIRRMYVQMSRNRLMLYIQFFHHLLSGLLIGSIFYDIGNDASQAISAFKFALTSNVFFLYTHVMLPVLLFPLEVKLLRREYFNRWYSLKAYYVALTICTLPLMIFLGTMFISIVYFMTGQPLELDRFINFLIIGLLIAITSQGLGYMIGAFFNILSGSVVAPAILAPLLALSVYGMGYKGFVHPFMKFLMSLTFLRFGMVGICAAVFNNRAPLDCPEEEIYCHYRSPEIMLSDMGMAGSEFMPQVIAIILNLVLFRTVSYLALKYKMTSEFTSIIANYASKVIRLKE